MSDKVTQLPLVNKEMDEKTLFAALNTLVKPAEQGSKGELHDILELNVKNALEELHIESYNDLDTLKLINITVSPGSSIRWRFVSVSLHILLVLKKCLNHIIQEEQLKKSKTGEKIPKNPPRPFPGVDLTVFQQKLVRTCLQFVVSIGLLPSLLPGVGLSLAARCSNAQNLKEENLVVIDKYERLSGVTRGLVACCETPALRTIILAHHLGDMMAALAQLSFVPLKKPVPAEESDGQDSPEQEFVMTPEIWSKLQHDRKSFQKCFLSFVAQAYQPSIIRELLLLQGSSEFVGISRVPPPSWLKRVCIQQLIHCLTRPSGVSALMRAICDSTPDTGADWSKLDTVARLITHVHTLNAEQYYHNICSQVSHPLVLIEEHFFKSVCSQLVDFLNLSKPSPQPNLYLTVAILCIKALHEKKPLMCMRYVLDIIMKPLLISCNIVGQRPVLYKEVELLHEKLDKLFVSSALQEKSAHSDKGGDTASQESIKEEEKQESNNVIVIVTEEELSKCIETLHRCFVAPQSEMSSLPIDLLASVAPVLFCLHQKIYPSSCYLKQPVHELLVKFLTGCKRFSVREIYSAFLFGDKVDEMLTVSDKVEFVFGPTGGVQLQICVDDGVDPLIKCEEAGDCLLELLDAGDKSGDLTYSLFVALLTVLTQSCTGSKQRTGIEPQESAGDFFNNFAEHSNKSVVAIKLLAILAENPIIQERIVKDPSHVIHFIKYMLDRDANFLMKEDDMDDTDKDLDLESLFLVLMVLSVVINDPGSTNARWEPFKELIKPLKVIRQNVTNDELKRFADKLYNTIVTHGVVRENTTQKTAQKAKDRNKESKKSKEKTDTKSAKVVETEPSEGDEEDYNCRTSPSVSEQDSFHSCIEEEGDCPSGGPVQLDFKKLSRCEQALFDACANELPVRGHALIEFGKLIKEGDKEAQRHKNHIIRVFQENIRHTDSYIYLSSIDGLAAMANIFPSTILHALLDEFNEIRSRRNGSEDEISQLKMKVGEALMRATKSLGDILPSYKTTLMNSFLSGTKDIDPFVRASSLSNVGALCQLLGFRVGNHMTEILYCVRCIVHSDPSVEVRRSAMLVLSLLLEGLGKDALKVLEGAVLEVYRTLKAVYQRERDEIVKIHVHLALEELERSTLNFLFPKLNIEKEIYVLDVPQS
uniref:Transport and Golgi organization protein 6 homolog n=2 Tax=Timema TaxID=61471 RepID=A0A7R9E4L5_9NEOP|nr:unnamed protein product [Timema monikensis]